MREKWENIKGWEDRMCVWYRKWKIEKIENKYKFILFGWEEKR